MFGGESGALAPQKNALGGANRPTVVFVGSALNFSDQIIRIANIEFDGVAFERCETVAELKATELDQGNIVAIILDETMGMISLKSWMVVKRMQTTVKWS